MTGNGKAVDGIYINVDERSGNVGHCSHNLKESKKRNPKRGMLSRWSLRMQQSDYVVSQMECVVSAWPQL